MTLRIEIIPPSPRPPSIHGVPDENDYESLVMASCDALGETDARFDVRGFGQAPWPVDVSYDLSTFVEQLPELFEDLRARRPGEVDFYGQGIERTLVFEPQGATVAVHCRSRTRWTPDPATEVAGYEDVIGMLSAAMSRFSESLLILAPDIARLPPFSEWRDGHSAR